MPEEPLQVHVHGPLRDTMPAVPVAHKLVLGAVANALLAAVPHEPARDAEQLAFVLEPLQAHVHGPAPPDTLLAVPVAQRLMLGAVVNAFPFAGPQDPAEPTRDAEQLALMPAEPLHVHVHGPLPDMPVRLPVAQRPVLGIVVNA